MSDKLSSRVQGLRFMQRGAQRAALAQGKSAAEAAEAAKPADAAPAPQPTSEQWFVPPERCVRVAAPPADAGNWGAWLATEGDDEGPLATIRRESLGRSRGRGEDGEDGEDGEEGEDEDDEDGEGEDGADSDEDSSDASSARAFRKPPSAGKSKSVPRGLPPASTPRKREAPAAPLRKKRAPSTRKATT